MPIRQDDNQPNRRFGIINLVLIGFGVLLLASSFIPSNGMQQVPRVPYSLFIDQVNDGAVKRAFITQDQIRYELIAPEEGTPPVLATTPIFDMDLPQRLEAKGVEFAAAPPKKTKYLHHDFELGRSPTNFYCRSSVFCSSFDGWRRTRCPEFHQEQSQGICTR
jgi:ATP-dependent Zn protease